MPESSNGLPAKDVVIQTTAQRLAHKWAGKVPAGEECYWRVSGTPRQTAAGNRIWFVTSALDGAVFAFSTITGVEEGRLWFEPVRDFGVYLTLDAPTRGFTYADPDDVHDRIEGGSDV